MQQGRASRTAQVAAAARAAHPLYASPPIFEDPYALGFTSPGWRRILLHRPLRWLVFDGVLRTLRPVGLQVVARSRYAEDCLARAIETGVRQYVIVGAGFDSFALRRRDLADRIQVFEIDHPDTQRLKRARLHELEVELPKNLHFAAVNFEKETIAEGLARTDYRPGESAFFSWLGTTPYLTRSATLDTLRSIAGSARPGSEIVFDYLTSEDALTPSERRQVRRLKRFTARRGEPLIGEFRPDEIGPVLRSVGFELIENLSGRAQEQRYFAGRSDGLRPMPDSYFAHAKVSAGGAAPRRARRR